MDYKEVWNDEYERARESGMSEKAAAKHADNMVAQWTADQIDDARERMKYGEV
jgi:hypothetical protein